MKTYYIAGQKIEKGDLVRIDYRDMVWKHHMPLQDEYETEFQGNIKCPVCLRSLIHTSSDFVYLTCTNEGCRLHGIKFKPPKIKIERYL